MNRRQRLMATLRGEPVDQPAVNFYGIDGTQDLQSADPFNIYSHPSWRPLIEMAREKTDRIVCRTVAWTQRPPDPLKELTRTEVFLDAQGSRFTTTTLQAGKRMLTRRTCQDRDVNTVWTIEHLLKDMDDVVAWLNLPERPIGGVPNLEPVLQQEQELGETGIVMLDASDPLCCAAALFEMGQFTIVAMTEPALFRRILDRFAREIYWRVEASARALPGRLWRICGPEYATPPYLPPRLFHEYVTMYDRPMVESIHRYGGYARLHSHGRLKQVLDEIVATGCMGLDPIEPPPQGDVELAYVREKYGSALVLFGNLEMSDIENLPAAAFREKVRRAIRDGTRGQGRGFVLTPSARPFGRVLAARTLTNYGLMIEEIERL